MKNLKFLENALEAQLSEYIRLGNLIKQMEATREALRGPIEAAALLAPENTLSIGDMICVAAHVERENFKLAEAKKVLNMDLLKPFISKSTYVRLTTKVVKL